MSKIKKPIVFIVITILILLVTFLLRRYLPAPLSDYSSDVVAIAALLLVVWDRFFKVPKVKLRKYNVDVQKIDGDIFNPVTLHIMLNNSGEVDVNIKFAWVDYHGCRFEFTKVEDHTRKQIDSLIVSPAQSVKDVYVTFKAEKNNWQAADYEINEAIEKKETRLLDRITQNQAEVCWFDGTRSSQKSHFLFGVLVKNQVKEIIDRPQRVLTKIVKK